MGGFENKFRDKIIYEKIDLTNGIFDSQQSLTPEKCTKYIENLKKVKLKKNKNNFYK